MNTVVELKLALCEVVENSLEKYHGHKCHSSLPNCYIMRDGSGRVAIEAYVTHPDNSHGWEHTVDNGKTWIPREESVL